MGVLMIQCPSTGREVSTGIEMLDVEQLPAVKATTVCPACGRVTSGPSTMPGSPTAAGSTASSSRIDAA